MKLKRFNLIGMAICIAFVIAATETVNPLSLWSSPAVASEARPGTITVTGTGKASARPDLAILSVGVVSEAKTARLALDKNSKAMRDVIAVLRKEGLGDTDLQTSNFGIDPRYDYAKSSISGTKTAHLVGYSARNQVTAKIRDLSKVGGILDAVVAAGSNRIDGISFTVSDPDPLHAAARKDAVRDAIAKAKLYTDAAGTALGALLNISDSRSTPIRPIARNRVMMAEAASVPIEAGEATIHAEVTMTWAIAN